MNGELRGRRRRALDGARPPQEPFGPTRLVWPSLRCERSDKLRAALWARSHTTRARMPHTAALTATTARARREEQMYAPGCGPGEVGSSDESWLGGVGGEGRRGPVRRCRSGAGRMRACWRCSWCCSARVSKVEGSLSSSSLLLKLSLAPAASASPCSTWADLLLLCCALSAGRFRLCGITGSASRPALLVLRRFLDDLFASRKLALQHGRIAQRTRAAFGSLHGRLAPPTTGLLAPRPPPLFFELLWSTRLSTREIARL